MNPPTRFQAPCAFCPDVVDTRPGHGQYQRVTGWTRQRSGGGTNAIALAVREDVWAHAVCVDVERSKGRAVSWDQPELPLDL